MQPDLARDLGLRRVRTLTRRVAAGAVVLTGLGAGLAAANRPGTSNAAALRRRTTGARRTATTSGNGSRSRGDDSQSQSQSQLQSPFGSSSDPQANPYGDGGSGTASSGANTPSIQTPSIQAPTFTPPATTPSLPQSNDLGGGGGPVMSGAS